MVLGTEWYWYRMVLAGSRHAAQSRVSAGSDKARFISRPPGPCIAAGEPASIEGRGERPVGRGNHVARTHPAPCRRRGRSARVTFGVASAAGTLSPKEQLGKAIFFDQNLSLNRNLACASCHGAAVGFTGPLSAINQHGAVYEGSIAGAFGNRKPPSSAYTAMSPILHVDKTGTWVGGNFW